MVRKISEVEAMMQMEVKSKTADIFRFICFACLKKCFVLFKAVSLRGVLVITRSLILSAFEVSCYI